MKADICTEVSTCRTIIQRVHVDPILFDAGLSLKGTFSVPIHAFYAFGWSGEHVELISPLATFTEFNLTIHSVYF